MDRDEAQVLSRQQANMERQVEGGQKRRGPSTATKQEETMRTQDPGCLERRHFNKKKKPP